MTKRDDILFGNGDEPLSVAADDFLTRVPTLCRPNPAVLKVEMQQRVQRSKLGQ